MRFGWGEGGEEEGEMGVSDRVSEMCWIGGGVIEVLFICRTSAFPYPTLGRIGRSTRCLGRAFPLSSRHHLTLASRHLLYKA